MTRARAVVTLASVLCFCTIGAKADNNVAAFCKGEVGVRFKIPFRNIDVELNDPNVAGQTAVATVSDGPDHRRFKCAFDRFGSLIVVAPIKPGEVAW
jgi:hypothetical protein